MIYPGACNRCGGDLYWEDEEYLQYSGYKCFQGGHFQKEITKMVEPELQQVSQSEKPKRVFTKVRSSLPTRNAGKPGSWEAGKLATVNLYHWWRDDMKPNSICEKCLHRTTCTLKSPKITECRIYIRDERCELRY